MEVTDKNFEAQVLKAKEPVLVDFWATWCGPCQFTTPIVHELEEEYKGKLKVAQVDVDANPQTPQKYSVLSIPTFLFMKEGKVVDSMIGAAPKDEFIRHIEKLLPANK